MHVTRTKLELSVAKRGSKTMRKTNKQIKHVRAVKARYEDLLLAWPGVMSVGVGLRQQDDAPTDEICIVVTVRNKRTTDNLSPDEALPDQIEGVPVDVQESGDIVPWVSLASGVKAGNGRIGLT